MVTRETLVADGLTVLGFNESVVGDAVPRLVDFGRLLEDVAIPRGYVGPAESGKLVERHILESAALAQFLPKDGSMVDVGSGAGLPGIVLAILREDPVVIVEAQKARAAFVRSVVRALELDSRVEIVAARAEDAARSGLRDSMDAATARALADLPVAVELVLPFVRAGGRAVFSAPGAVPPTDEASPAPMMRSAGGEGDPEAGSDLLKPTQGPEPGDHGSVVLSDAAEVGGPGSDVPSGAAEASSLLGGNTPRRLRFEVPGSEEARWVMIVDKLRPTPDRYPRRAGVPAQRPLGS